MSSSNGVSLAAGFGIVFEAVGQQGHNRGSAADISPQTVQREGLTQLLIDVFRQARLADRRWKVLVLRTFTRNTKYPVLSQFIPDEAHKGVRFRFKPAKGNRGWVLCVVNATDLTLEALAVKLREAAGDNSEIFRPQATDPDVIQDAVAAVGRLEANGVKRYSSFDLFCKAVADELGPDEDPAYWRQALTSAHQGGLLYQGTFCYTTRPALAPQPAKPEPPKVSATLQKAADLEAATPVTAGSHLKPKDPEVDEEALDLLVAGAEAIDEKLKRLKALKNERKDLKNALAQAHRKVQDAEEALRKNAADIKAAAAGISLGDLVENAAFLS